MKKCGTVPCALGVIALFVVSGAGRAALPNYNPPTANQMRMHYIDVGQGSAVLAEFACGTVLIDTGGEKHENYDSVALLTKYLDAYFARRTDLDRTINLLILTHAHIDHTRGVPTVLEKYTVRNIVDNGLETGSGGSQQKAAHTAVRESHGGIKYQAVAEKKITEITGMTNDIIDPIGKCSGGIDPKIVALWGALDASRGWTQTVLTNGNNSSVVIRLDFGKASFLFPGDLEDEVQGDLLDFYADGCTTQCMLDVDVYQVSHHGSHNGTSTEFLEAMKPKIATISMGTRFRLYPWTAYAYGHPRQSVIQELLDPVHGITGKRAVARKVFVATRGVSKRKRPAGAPPQGSQFVSMTMENEIYGTGWDGAFVINVQSDGGLKVDTEN